MAENDDKLEAQLDALMKEAAGAEDEARADAKDEAKEAGAMSQAEQEDLAGSEFADQVQKMLDEAKAELGHDLAAGAVSEADIPGGASKPAASEQELIGQIDKMLADQADAALEGQFESVDDLLSEEKAAADHAAEAAKQEIENKELAEATSTDADAPALSEKAKAVGAELDAEQAAGGEGDEESHMQSIEEMFPDEEDPSMVLDNSQAAVTAAIAKADAGHRHAAPKPARAVHRPSPVMRLMIAVNRPVARLPLVWKNAVGMLGIANILGAAVLFSFMWAGIVGVAASVMATSIIAYVALRKLFLC